MMIKVRIFQDTRQKAELGARNAPWYVGWRVGGKRYSERVGSKLLAQQIAAKKAADFLCGAAGIVTGKPWAEFRAEYETTIVAGFRSETSQKLYRHALDMFERICRPGSVQHVDAKTLDVFVAGRQREGMMAATITKELKVVNAALNAAKRWSYVAVVPSRPKVAGFLREKRFIPERIYASVFAHCDAAIGPVLPQCSPGDFWRALLGLLWVAPCRIRAMLAVKWADVDLTTGTLLSRAEDNKQHADRRKFFPLSLVPLLQKIRGTDERLFPWDYADRLLWVNFHRIQKAAGVEKPYYGFHDFRRSFATLNRSLPADVKQSQMDHMSPAMMKVYDKYAEQQELASHAHLLHVPECLKGGAV